MRQVGYDVYGPQYPSNWDNDKIDETPAEFRRGTYFEMVYLGAYPVTVSIKVTGWTDTMKSVHVQVYMHDGRVIKRTVRIKKASDGSEFIIIRGLYNGLRISAKNEY